MRHPLHAKTSVESHGCCPAQLRFVSPELPELQVVVSDELSTHISRALWQMNYKPARDSGESSLVGWRAFTQPILIIEDHLHRHFAESDALGEPWRSIVISDDESFEFRMNCVHKCVDAIVSRDKLTPELGEWIEHFYSCQHAEPYAILIVDDDRQAAEICAEYFRQDGATVDIVDDPKTLLRAIGGTVYDIIVMDLEMPEANGLELARMIRQNRRHISAPIVFLSAHDDGERQLQAMRDGGDDFISKRVAPLALRQLILLRMERARNLRALIERDGLTGLLNHRRFKERLALEFDRARRNNSTFSVVMIDIDTFKRVNDQHGHQTGDLVLATMSRIFSGWLRRIDVIGRYGGEEFGVMLLDADGEAAVQVIEALRLRIAEETFPSAAGTFSITVSAGVASSRDAPSVDALIGAADAALYAAKQDGRNQVRRAPDFRLAQSCETPARKPPRQLLRANASWSTR
jgi:diguanylate cyclase (GGDEF)-like protein